MLNIDLLKNVLIISVASGCVCTLLIQKIKENLKRKKWLFLITISVNMIVGTLFALSFSNISIIYSLWCGLFGIVDSSVLYNLLEEKIFTPFSEMQKDKEKNPIILERDDK